MKTSKQRVVFNSRNILILLSLVMLAIGLVAGAVYQGMKDRQRISELSNLLRGQTEQTQQATDSLVALAEDYNTAVKSYNSLAEKWNALEPQAEVIMVPGTTGPFPTFVKKKCVDVAISGRMRSGTYSVTDCDD